MKSNSKHKASALTKTRVALPIAAVLLALIALFGMTACPNSVEGGAATGTANGGNTGGLKWHEAPFIEGGASLILSPDKLTIRVTVTTSDNSPITVEGCDKTELTSGTRTELKAKNTGVVFKGKITKLQVGDRSTSIFNKLTALNVQGLNALQYLDCCNNQLTELNVQGLNALQYLDCYNNKLTSLNVQGLSALQSLDCGSNQLTELNVQGLSALQGLRCGSNQLTELNVQGLSALKGLDCKVNKLTELNVQGLSALKDLMCIFNKLTELNVQGLNALQSLNCWDNQLTALNVQGLNALQYLDCSSNQLTELNVQGLSALKDLRCGSNKLTEFNVQGLNALQSLDCSSNQLTELNVQGLNALHTLDCCANQLNAEAFKKLFNDLPYRLANRYGSCYLYYGVSEAAKDNHKDFASPGELKTAFDNAKTTKHWKMYKRGNGAERTEL